MRIVAALGGNALLKSGQKGTAEEQYANIETACRQLIRIAAEHELVITHGNGPQVGRINLQNEAAREETPTLPLDICGAMSQGQIGYMLQQGLSKELSRQGLELDPVTVVTRILVCKDDPTLVSPGKPIGSYFSRKEAEARARDLGEKWIEDKTRGGWRKVVASPRPVWIVEERAIKTLLENRFLVIALGGGGIPVLGSEQGGYQGVEAVVDKDLAGGILADAVGATIFLILTDVPAVYLDYGKPTQRPLGTVSLDEMVSYSREGHFAAGSMGPKVEAAVKFARERGHKTIITSLELALEAIEGRAGTCLAASGCGEA